MADSLKEFLSEEFGGEETDWNQVSDKEEIHDDIPFYIKEFANSKIGKIATLIYDDDTDEANVYIKEKTWSFFISNDKSSISSIIGNTKLFDADYCLVFYENDNDGNFDWHVGEYLHAFKDLPTEYEEDSENEFVYSGTKNKTFSDLVNDLTSYGFVFDRYEKW